MLSAFYAGQSPDSLRARFLGYARGINGRLARSFCTLDHMHDEGFVAIAPDADGNRIVGHLCLAQVAPSELELGVAVSDEFQGRGIGRQLFETAIAWARDHHFTSLVASCFAENSRVLALLTSSPNGAAVSSAGSGVVEVVIPLESPLPEPELVFPAGMDRSRARRQTRHTTSRKPLHVFWRRRPQPGRAAGD